MTPVTSTTPSTHLGHALGLLQTAIFTGSSVGPLAGGLLAARMG
jgi:DHA1 family multidrug resistance protein-like MFS transporter